MTYLNRDIIDDLLNNSDASNEDKKVVSSLFESVDYNVEEFLRTNYLEAIRDEELKGDIVRFCFLKKKCISGRYGVYVYLNSNSVILQGSKECQAYHLDGSPIPIPQNVYLYPNCDYIGRIMIFEDRSIKSQPELIEIDGIKQLVHSNGNRGIMTTDCRILVPAICKSIKMEDYWGVTILFDEDLSMHGKLLPVKEHAAWIIKIPYNEDVCLGFGWNNEFRPEQDENRTWQKMAASIETFLSKLPSVYTTEISVEEAILLIFEAAEFYGAGPMTEEDRANCKKEVRRIIGKYLKP